ncbi:hypothetical protein GCM10007275_21150 [Jeotgalicoccus coquinae]|uniref:Uncharacterized protein n=1 Tax=Jeotgalicoccus coquinae TaxID=709509 RepID=A0A6V7RRL1_9STAP|nr:DUF6176 family protein [Jeotgalicoccus coquinae]MBB6424181.1 hypothetical protein [Jeotgalicoccus coquinae]GGE25880.1 hypothetical protein GCM10007275_21150 [Jeotgalicoccus coquinae]CAD2081478.1 hypothetical protein JEOCOQ751_01972 [Jeotgalicoccus coquinae]
MQVELTRFRVKKGKEELVDQWMEFLNEHMNDALLTLDGEKMFVETIMRDTMGQHDYLYWYSIQADDGDSNSETERCIDSKHLDYFHKCIDITYRPKNLKTEVVMIPQRIKKQIEAAAKEEA